MEASAAHKEGKPDLPGTRSPLGRLDDLSLVAAVVKGVLAVVVAREAIWPIHLLLLLEPADVATPHRLPSPSLTRDRNVGVGFLSSVDVVQPHRIPLVASISEVHGGVQRQIRAASLEMSSVTWNG